MVQRNLDEYNKANLDFPKPSNPPRPRRTRLIITDLSMDTVAPLLHEYTDLLDRGRDGVPVRVIV